MATTDLYRAMIETEAAWSADAMNLDLLRAADAAFSAHLAAEGAARDRWDAIPAGDAKDSAEQNAYDTEDTGADALRWYEIALRTYEMNVDTGAFPAAGRAA